MLGAEAGAPRDEGHPVGDDERRVEPDAELADEMRVLGAVGGELLEELARARLGDGADVLDHLLPRHADAVVGHGDRARRRVVGDADLRVGIVLEKRTVGERLEAQLVHGVRGVRDQLAQEDLLVAVQGVDHQVEELRHLGLEAERFPGGSVGRVGHGSLSIYTESMGDRETGGAVLDTLLENHRAFLAYLTRRVGDRALAEDLLQEAFAKTLARPDQVPDGEALVPWFYRTLRNAAIDRFRRQGAADRALEAFARELETVEAVPEEARARGLPVHQPPGDHAQARLRRGPPGHRGRRAAGEGLRRAQGADRRETPRCGCSGRAKRSSVGWSSRAAPAPSTAA